VWSWLVLAAAVARAGTPSLVLDINTQRQPQSSSPIFLGTLGGYDYFIATPVPGSSQSALYKSDGTDAGTTCFARAVVLQLNPDRESRGPLNAKLEHSCALGDCPNPRLVLLK
jgi:hypothetical protein